jgi:hypothetical protein
LGNIPFARALKQRDVAELFLPLGWEKMQMASTIRSAVAVMAVALGLLAAVPSARAVEVYNSGGFEPPRFAPGALAGQDVTGVWLKDSGAGTAVVQTAVRQSGTQAVQFTRPANVNGDTRYGVSRPLVPTGALQIVRVNFDMNVTQTTLPTVPFGPFFGVEGYDAFNDDPKLIGSVGVDATTGDILYQDGFDGFLVETGVKAPFGQWNRYTLEIDYQSDEYRVIYNGTEIASSTFVDPGITGFTDAPLAALAATFESLGTASGTAYFDNYSIEIVPEPSALAVVGLGALGLLRRRRA